MKRTDSEVLSAAVKGFLGDYLPHQRAYSAHTILSYRDSLKLLRKGSSENLAARAVRNLKTAGISVMAGLILGNPDDTEESIRRTFRWCREQDVDEILAQFLTPYPGTEIRAELLREGLVEDPDQWRTYNGMFAHCRTRSGLMPADLEAIVYEEHSAFKRHRMAYAPELKFCDYRYNPVRDFGDNPGNSFHEKAAFARERWLKMNQFDLGRDGSATTAVRGEEVRA